MLTYLQSALKGGPAKNVIQRLTQMAESYEEASKCLKDHYDCRRVTRCEHVRSIVQAPPFKANNSRELLKLYNLCNHHIRTIKASDHYSIDTFLTIVMELKLDTKQKWVEFSNNSLTMLQHSVLLKFLDLQAWRYESMHPSKSRR